MRSERGCSDGPFLRLNARALRSSAMCGRFTQNLSWAEIHRLAGLIGEPRNLAPRYNIAPTTPIEVIRASDAGNELVPMYWGPCALLVEKASSRAPLNLQRPGRDGRRAANVSRRVQIPSLHYSGIRLLLLVAAQIRT
jgi:putative SOS response-associated peptidase YedK